MAGRDVACAGSDFGVRHEYFAGTVRTSTGRQFSGSCDQGTIEHLEQRLFGADWRGFTEAFTMTLKIAVPYLI